MVKLCSFIMHNVISKMYIYNQVQQLFYHSSHIVAQHNKMVNSNSNILIVYYILYEKCRNHKCNHENKINIVTLEGRINLTFISLLCAVFCVFCVLRAFCWIISGHKWPIDVCVTNFYFIKYTYKVVTIIEQ